MYDLIIGYIILYHLCKAKLFKPIYRGGAGEPKTVGLLQISNKKEEPTFYRFFL
jgi:hypothetical protein